MMLDGPQIGKLTNILCDTFQLDDLTILVRTTLNMRLDDDVSTADGKRNAVFKLIDGLNEKGRVVELIQAVRQARANRPDVVAFCDPLLAQAAREQGIPPPTRGDKLPQAIAAFRVGFLNRGKVIGYLKANKELHEVLHNLQEFQPQLAYVKPGCSLTDEDRQILSEWHNVARQSVGGTEFHEDHNWIGKLAAAIADLNGADCVAWERAIRRLANLPVKEQVKLNDELVKCARRLEVDELLGHVNNILNAIGMDREVPAVERLRGEVTRFRDRCQKLVGLIHSHDRCQKVAGALLEADGLLKVTPDDLTYWNEIQTWLGELGGLPASLKIHVVREATQRFAVADPAEATAAFATFRERFDHLFFKTDNLLLNEIVQLPITWLSLETILRQFP